MGNTNTTMEDESGEGLKVNYIPHKLKRIKGAGNDDNELFDYRESQVEDYVPTLKDEEDEGSYKSKDRSSKKRSKTKNRTKSSKKSKSQKRRKSKKRQEEDLEQKKHKGKDKDREPSNRVKRIEDYFQWDSITEDEKNMYYDFVITAKNTWNDNGYDDEAVRKVVLDKVSLMRFCIARDFNPKKTYEMWMNWVEWRLEYQPHKIRGKEVLGTSLDKWFYLNGQNKRGCPCIVISPGATTEVYDVHAMWKLAAYTMEKACRIWDRNGTTQMWVIFDRKNMSNGTEKRWLPLYKQLSSIIQDYYPERLNHAYILHMNWFARLIFNICKPFIAKKTRNKVGLIKYYLS